MASFRNQFPNVKVIGEEGQEMGQELDLDWIESDWIVKSQSEEVLELTTQLPENLQNIAAEDITVWVDPLDGTAEYTQGLLDHVTVLIGLCLLYFSSRFNYNIVTLCVETIDEITYALLKWPLLRLTECCLFLNSV